MLRIRVKKFVDRMRNCNFFPVLWTFPRKKRHTFFQVEKEKLEKLSLFFRIDTSLGGLEIVEIDVCNSIMVWGDKGDHLGSRQKVEKPWWASQ